ncbi:hypothetical protein AYO49_05460 [Verrucomicrobiaceae bacterium SCGC AG-212-N21]|nr:hypothetical protein AYO49_05460 [Verrucomicrobiaceae bacterium SCGC AG-212-N21]
MRSERTLIMKPFAVALLAMLPLTGGLWVMLCCVEWLLHGYGLLAFGLGMLVAAALVEKWES